MPVPARKKSNSSGRRRRAHDALKQATSSNCLNCESAIQPHHVCSTCGFYKGKQVIKTKKASERIVKKAQKAAKKTSKA